MDPTGTCTSAAWIDFHYLLVRLARQLHRRDYEGLAFVHQIPEPPEAVSDIGLYALKQLQAEGKFDFLSPDKLQEILRLIGRKDMSHDIKEYKHSRAFKKATKLEAKRERESRRREGATQGEASEERHVAEIAATEKERKWRETFAMALTSATELVEQKAEQIRQLQEKHDNSDQASKRIEEALHSMETAQEEVERLSTTLKKTSSKAGLNLRTEVLDDEGPSADTRKQVIAPDQSPLTRRNTFDGVPRRKCANHSTPTPTSPLSTTHTITDTPPTPTASQSAGLKKKHSPPPVKAKPTNWTSLRHKLEKVQSDAETLAAESTSLRSQTNSDSTLNTMSTNSSTSNSSSSLPEEHVYEDPNLHRPRQEQDLYENSSMVVASTDYQREKDTCQHEKVISKQVSNASIQTDSGYGHEDESWGGELIALKERSQHGYVNVKILEEGPEYASLKEQPPPSESSAEGAYTVPTNAKR